LKELSVGAGSDPMNPPMAITGLPVAMMNGAAVIDPLTATRYLALP
jgi:hypothetical protein